MKVFGALLILGGLVGVGLGVHHGLQPYDGKEETNVAQAKAIAAIAIPAVALVGGVFVLLHK